MERVKRYLQFGAVGITAFLPGVALAGPFGALDEQAGKEIAEKACSACHAIPSRADQEPSSSLPGPSFAEIANGPKVTHESLRVFLLTTHSNIAHPGGMPNPTLTEKQIWQIAAYLASLRNTQERPREAR